MFRQVLRCADRDAMYELLVRVAVPGTRPSPLQRVLPPQERAVRAASPREARAISFRAPASSRRMSSPWPVDAIQVVEIRQRLVEARRAEHDLERLDVVLLVEDAQPLRRRAPARCACFASRPRADDAGSGARTEATVPAREAMPASTARLPAARRANRARAPPRVTSPRSQHRAHAATLWSATDSRHPPTVRSTPPGRSRRTKSCAVAACVPALARGRTVPQCAKQDDRTSCRNEQVSRQVCVIPIDADPNTLLTCLLVTYRPHPVRPSRPRTGSCYS